MEKKQEIRKVLIDDIIVDTLMEFDEKDILEQAEGIKKFGLLNPIMVSQDGEGKYHLVAGQKRLQAAKRAGIQVVEIELEKDI